LTKVDKEKATALVTVRAAAEAELKSHGAAYPDILATSAAKKLGLEEVRATVAALAEIA
jgi:GTP-binding protein